VKRSAAVPLTLVATAAAGALAACSRTPEAEPLNCVESTSGRVVPDSLCRAAGAAAPTAAAQGTPAAREGSGGFGISPIGLFGWYYGGRVISGLVRGGSYAPMVGRSYRSPTGSFLGAGATRGGAPVRPSIASPANARSSTFGRPSAGRPSTRGGFGGIGAGRAGGS
jgi:hypothetical protein